MGVDCCSVLSCHPDLAKASCKSLLGTANMANFALKAFFTPTPAGAAILVATLLAFRSTLVKASWSKLAILLLLYINRGNLPLRWHFKLTAIALRARFRWEFARLGLRKATSEQNKIGLKGGDLALGGVGKNVLEIVSTRRAVVGYAESDYNLHMSNSNYAQAVDFARMQFASDYVGTAFAQDGVMILLGASSFVYFREIPMFAKFSTETRVVAYDDKWAYILTRFLIPVSKSSKRAPSKSYATGEDVTVCACVLSKLCFKIGRANVTPEKVFVLSGMVGPADAENDAGRNWAKASALRKEKRGVKNWVQTEENDAGQYIRGVEDRNDKAIKIIHRLHDADRSAWLELDALY